MGGGIAPCESDIEPNDAVVACVIEAAAAGEAFHFGYILNDGGQHAIYDDHYLAADAPMRVRRYEPNDHTGNVSGTLRAEPSFEACQGLGGIEGWDCISAALSTEVLDECFSEYLDSGYGLLPSP